MSKELLFQVSPEIANNDALLKKHIAKLERVSETEIQHISILKRSIDARQKSIKFNLKVNLFLQSETFIDDKIELPNYEKINELAFLMRNSFYNSKSGK